MTKKRMPVALPLFDSQEIGQLKACLDSRWVAQGPMTRRFELLMAERHKVKYALATTSCTAALHLAVLSLGLGKGDEVVVPAFTWITSASCAEYACAKAVFADVKPATYNLDPEAFAAAITPRTRAVVAVHLFGQAAEMGEILAIARRHSLYVIEDAACAIGTTYDGRPVGALGNIGCFSFHPRKVITTGEGGMVTTNDKMLAEKVSILRNHGASGIPGPETSPDKPYAMGRFDHIGFNLRLSDIQASVGIAQMAKLDSLLKERARLAKRYNELLKDIDELVLPVALPLCGHTYQSYVVRVSSGKRARNRIMDYLDSQGIQTRPGTHAVHRLGYYAHKYKIRPEQFPAASACEDTTITLPLFPGMTEKQQRFVHLAIKKAVI